MLMYFYVLFIEKQFMNVQITSEKFRLLLLTNKFNLNSVKVALVRSSSANEFLFSRVHIFCNTNGKRKYCFLCSLNH